MTTQEWIAQQEGCEVRPIPGYYGYYASANGQVWSDIRRRTRERVGTEPIRLKHHRLGSPGFERPGVTLYQDGFRQNCYVAWIMCITFLGEPPTPRHQACLKDTSKPVSADNVVWDTNSGKMQRVQERRGLSR